MLNSSLFYCISTLQLLVLFAAASVKDDILVWGLEGFRVMPVSDSEIASLTVTPYWWLYILTVWRLIRGRQLDMKYCGGRYVDATLSLLSQGPLGKFTSYFLYEFPISNSVIQSLSLGYVLVSHISNEWYHKIVYVSFQKT